MKGGQHKRAQENEVVACERKRIRLFATSPAVPARSARAGGVAFWRRSWARSTDLHSRLLSFALAPLAHLTSLTISRNLACRSGSERRGPTSWLV